MRRLVTFHCVLIGIAFAGSGAISATTVTNTNDSGPGSLRQAIADTAAGGTVDFALTGCPCTITLTTGHLEVSKSLTILGPGANMLTISGGANFRVFFLVGEVSESSLITIESLTVANGAPSDPVWPFTQGGGIFTNGGNKLLFAVILRHMKISGNRGWGAGVYASTTDLTIENTTISENDAFFGGGLYINWFNKVRIRNSSILNNTDSTPFYAPTLYSINYNTVELENVTIEGNTVANGGPVIQNQWSTLTLTNSTISGNSGGILNLSDDPIDAKEAPSLLTIANSTITGNSEGVYTAQFHPCCPAQTTLRNSIVANNGEDTITGGSGKFISGGYNLIGNAGSVPTFIHPGDQAGMPGSPIDPRLEPLEFNGGPTRTHAPKLNSPAVDKGKAFGSKADQRGTARPNDNPDLSNAPGGDGSDIGAYEVQFPVAGSVSIGGRVNFSGGVARSRGYLTLTDSAGNVRYAGINPFGYYRFHEVPLGRSFALHLQNKGWVVVPQNIFVAEAISNLDIVANRSP